MAAAAPPRPRQARHGNCSRPCRCGDHHQHDEESRETSGAKKDPRWRNEALQPRFRTRVKGSGDRRNDGRRSHKGGSSEDCRLQRRQERQRRGRRPATVREGNSGTARDAQLDRSEASTHPNAAIPAARQRRKQRDEPPEPKLTPTTNTHTREHRGEGGTGTQRTPTRQATRGARQQQLREDEGQTKPNNDSKARGQGLIPTGETPLKPLTGYGVASRRISPGTDNN